MIPVAEALRIVLEHTPKLPAESVPLTQAVGRLLAEDIVADTDLPPFDRAQMDGYAVRAGDTANVPVRLRVVGESVAGGGWHHELKAGEAVRIMTGAPVPAGADAVQQVELTRSEGDFEPQRTQRNPEEEPSRRAFSSVEDMGSVEILQTVNAGRSIVKRAEEIRAGETVLRAGEEITPAMIATLASFGYAQVKVGGRPQVVVMATGSELVGVDKKPGRDQIRDSNNYTIAAYATLAGAIGAGKMPAARRPQDAGAPTAYATLEGTISADRMPAERPQDAGFPGGAPVERLPLAGDNPGVLKQQLAEAAARADVLITSGGVSMGAYDFTKPALRELGAEIFFERVALRPGKPTVFARMGQTLVFGLPGNPVSVAVTFNLFVRAALRAMQGAKDLSLAEESAVLVRDVKGSIERESYLPAVLRTDENGTLLAEPLRWGGSSDFVGFARAKALIKVPLGVRIIAAGSSVSILRLPG